MVDSGRAWQAHGETSVIFRKDEHRSSDGHSSMTSPSTVSASSSSAAAAAAASGTRVTPATTTASTK